MVITLGCHVVQEVLLTMMMMIGAMLLQCHIDGHLE
jgi:hypothetical protein